MPMSSGDSEPRSRNKILREIKSAVMDRISELSYERSLMGALSIRRASRKSEAVIDLFEHGRLDEPFGERAAVNCRLRGSCRRS